MKLRLSSFRLAFFLIAILLILIILSAIIPQKNIAEDEILNWKEFLGDKYVVIEKLGLDRIYFSPTFFAVLGLLAISLVAGNIKRFKTIYQIEKTIVKARHLGSILFHLSLLVIISGIILNYLYKFEGIFALTEGQRAADTRAEYFRVLAGPLYPDRFDRFTIELLDVNPAYTSHDAQTEAAEIILRPIGGEAPITGTILTNSPLKWHDLEFHFGALTGYSPEVLITDTAGTKIFRNFIRLSTRKEKGRTVYADFVILPRDELKINVEVQPVDNAVDAAEFFVVVEHGHNPVYEGTLALADTASVDGLRLTIPRLRRWCYVDVIQSRFLGLVFAGFWTALAGMVIGFVPRVIGRKRRIE